MKPRTPTSYPYLIAALAVASLLSSPAWAAERAPAEAREQVSNDVKYLASDELEGRGPNTKGLQKAAEYIREEFQELGLKSGVEDGSYFQHFEINIDTKPVKAKTLLVLRGPEGEEIKLEMGNDFQPLAVGGSGKVKADLVFAGYGITAPGMKYNDYAESVEGKVVLIVRREPQQGSEDSVFSGKRNTQHSYIATKIRAAKQAKAAAILMVNDGFSLKDGKKDELTRPTGFGANGSGLPYAHLTRALADRVLKKTPIQAGDDELKDLATIEERIDKDLQPLTQPLEGWTAEVSFEFERVRAKVANVVGVLEGKGPLADETIVIGAHYDHIGYGPFGSRRPGVRAIHNGADDNATGTAAVMELARRFSQRDNPPPRRMVFIGFSGEERGLLGSRHYVQNPLFPLKDTVTMINFDMIGTLTDKGVTVGGVRSAKEFKEVVDAANEEEPMKLLTGGPLGGSDHSSFYQQKIPVIFFFTGMTNIYHTPDDDFERLNVDGMMKTIGLSERVARGVLNLPKRPEYTRIQTGRRRGQAYLGVVPNYDGEKKGVRITGVNEDSPAAKAGLKADDVIIKIGDRPVTDVESLTVALREQRPGRKAQIVVRRGEEEKSIEVTFTPPPRGR